MHRSPAITAARALALLLPFLAAGCGGGEEAAPPVVFAPLHYDYLTPLRLNVATLTIEDHAANAGPGDVSALSPVPPAQALEQMARDRLVPAGSAGEAVFVIDRASIVQGADALSGNMAVHLDIRTSDGNRAAYAEARVSRVRTLGGGHEDLRGALYTMTKAMMDDMNVEFEYQVRHSLKDWLQTTAPAAAAIPAPVQVQPLDAPAK